MEGQEREKIYVWWNDLNNDFIRLNQNYQDYMRELNSVKAEELMKTREFLVFKDRLIEYLRSFVRSLQTNVNVIEERLKSTERKTIERILGEVTEYELSIPRIDVEVDRELIYEKMQGRWDSLREWFAGEEGRESEAAKVFDTTNEIIRKITRYAARISEMSNSGIFDEEPYMVTVTPRVRSYREKAQRRGIRDRSREKEEARLATIQRLEEERRLLKSYIKDQRLDFAGLPQIEPHVRDVFLTWLSKALENKELRGKTEDGQIYYIENKGTEERCVVKAADGDLEMPAYIIRFEEKI